MNSRSKGKRGELELVRFLRGYGYDAHRGVQYQGGQESPDVVGLPFIHIECKRVEDLNIYEAYEQSKKDAGIYLPTVMHRKNDCEWLITMADNDFHVILQGKEIWTRTVIRERIQLYTHIENARADAYKNSVALFCVTHKRPEDAEMMITMPLHDWMPLYRDFELRQSQPKEEQG